MKSYFLLQYTRVNRMFSDAGILPVLGYVFGIGGSILISEYLFYKTDLAEYLIALGAVSLMFRFSERDRVEFLKMTFAPQKFLSVRSIENLIVGFPVAVYLVFDSAFLTSSVLILSALTLAFITTNSIGGLKIPTPFYKRPFEFIIGFRKLFFLFPLVYAFTFISLSVENLNLGVVSMLLVFLVSLSFYSKPEPAYFVWIYALSPARFLRSKLTTATGYSLLLAAPVVCALVVFYPQNAAFIFLFLFIGISFLWTVILAKYSAYPNELNVTEGIVIVMCMVFPPIMIAALPFFYFRSVRELSTFLK